MADTKITALTALTAADPANDVLPIVDVSDTTMAASGTTKKISVNNILGASGTATLASATITGDLTVDTSTLKVDSANNRVGIGTASPATILDIQSAGTLYARIQNTASTADAYLLAKNTVGEALFGINALGPYIYTGQVVPIVLTTGGSERYRVAGDGVATWSNVGGVAGTAMTLNSTGLGVGQSPSAKLDVYQATLGTAYFRGGYSARQLTLTATSDGSNDGAIHTFSIGSSAGQFLFANSGGTRLTIDSSGNVGVGVTPSAGGGCLQLKSGITFPATQVASSDANTLDDYEEGTWTGTLGGGTTSPTTPVTATGRYTKIGRVVTLQINFDNVNTTGASGNLFISGIPFTNSSVGSYGTVASYLAATFTETLVCVIDPNDSSSLILLDVKSNAAWSIAQHNAGTGRYVRATITYTVA